VTAIIIRALTGALFARHSNGNEGKSMLPSQILKMHRAEVLEIMTRYPMFTNLRVFGSVARGEDTEGSDIDFLVDPLPDATLFKLGGLYEDFEELLGVAVHITLTNENIKSSLKFAIDRDAINV